MISILLPESGTSESLRDIDVLDGGGVGLRAGSAVVVCEGLSWLEERHTSSVEREIQGFVPSDDNMA